MNINPSVSALISNLGAPFPSMTVAFPIPLMPASLIGQSFYSQSIWIDSLNQNTFFGPGGPGMLTSNAVRLKLGAF